MKEMKNNMPFIFYERSQFWPFFFSAFNQCYFFFNFQLNPLMLCLIET